MFKKIFFYLVVVLILPLAVSASTVSNFTNQTIGDDTIYPAMFAKPVMDFTIPNLKTDSTVDKLVALTLKNNGSARDAYEISAVKLWSDDYAAGWQGWGCDKLLATASYSNDSWYFNNLNVDIPVAGLRVFVTIDVRSSISARKTVQFYVPQLVDSNTNGTFDIGDDGLFMESKLNGPSDNNLMNDRTQSITTATYDYFAPEAIITNLTNNQTLTDVTSYTIQGQAQDQARAGVSWVKIGIGTSESSLTWRDVVSTDNYTNWTYSWQNIAPTGNYILKTKSADSYNNESTSIYPINIMAVATPIVVTPPETIATPAPVPVLLPDGSLIKSSSDNKVYFVAQGKKKRWITTGEVFEGLGFKWSKIQTVTDTELKSYTDGEDISVTYKHPDGTLIKYQTYPAVYLLQNGLRRHIANEAIFLAYGYHWDNIITIPDWEYYAEGVEITQ